jgi:hypothetical protein
MQVLSKGKEISNGCLSTRSMIAKGTLGSHIWSFAQGLRVWKELETAPSALATLDEQSQTINKDFALKCQKEFGDERVF